MFTRKAVKEVIDSFLNELKAKGFNPSKAVLFGSYAKGTPGEYSDIDLAVWDKQFTGCLPVDIEQLNNAKIKPHPLLEIHTFHCDETADNNPFIKEILSSGISIPV